MRKLCTAALAAAIASGASAQTVIQWPAPVAATEQGRRLSLPIGTPIMLATRTGLSTKDDLRPGQRVFLRVMENVSYQGQVLIPAGSPAYGEVSEAERNGHFGKRGSVAVTLSYVDTPYGPVQLTGDAGAKGRSGTALSVATIVLVNPWGFLIHGTSGRMHPMTPIQGYLASPLTFTTQPGAARAAATPVQSDQGVPAAVAMK